MTRKKEALSTVLALLLVCNAGCGCAMAMADVDSGPHAHHAQALDVSPDADCPHSDCNDCQAAVGMVAGKDTAQPGTHKLGLDHLQWSAVDAPPILFGGQVAATGPPTGAILRAPNTPVRRFDLQLE